MKIALHQRDTDSDTDSIVDIEMTAIALLVEDHARRQLVIDALQDRPFHVSTTRADQLNSSTLDFVDVVVLDASGDWETTLLRCAAVRNAAEHDQTPILLLMPEDSPTDLLDTASIIADDVLQAPFTPFALVSRLRMLARLRRSRLATPTNLHATLLDHTPVPVMVVDPSGTVTYANTAACRLFPGSTSCESNNLMTLLAAESGSIWVNMVAELWAGRRTRVRETLTMVTQQGESWHALVDAVAITCQGRSGLLLTLNNVTALHEQRREQGNEIRRLQQLNKQIVTSGISQRLEWAEELHRTIIEPLTSLQQKMEHGGDRGVARATAEISRAARCVQHTMAPAGVAHKDLAEHVADLLADLQTRNRVQTRLESATQGAELCPLVGNAIYRVLRDLLCGLSVQGQLHATEVFLWHERDDLLVHVVYDGARADFLRSHASWSDVTALGGEIAMTSGNAEQHALTMTVCMKLTAEKKWPQS